MKKKHLGLDNSLQIIVLEITNELKHLGKFGLISY